MLTCLCDAFYGEVGIATVRVLEHAGCEVEFDERQTCCGQPPFNAGDWTAARTIAEHCLQVFEGGEGVYHVTPSGSCAGMMRHGYSLLQPKGHADRPHMYELGEFLIDVLGVREWPLRGNRVGRVRKVALHRACHGRQIGLKDQQETLLRMVPGVEVAPIDQPEQCCGFGGAFSATHGKISSGIGLEKLRNVLVSGAEELVSGDMGCLMHLDGLIERHGLPLKTRHLAEVLAEVLPA